MNKKTIKTLLLKTFPNAIIQVNSSDNRHYEIIIQDKKFQGLSPINQHRAVYQALGKHAGTSLHAISLKTIIAEE